MSRSHTGDFFSASCLFYVFSTAFMILGCDMYMVRDTSKTKKKILCGGNLHITHYIVLLADE